MIIMGYIDSSVVSDIIRIVNKKNEIEKVVEKTEEDYHIEYIDDSNELAFCKAQEISYILQFDLYGNGFYKGVYGISNDLCVKVLLVNYGTDAINREWLLYNYIKREKPELLQFLAPILACGDNFLITKRGVPCNMLDWSDGIIVNKYHINSIIKLFKRNGIIFNDLENRIDNFGIIDGKLVIMDYDSWHFKWQIDIDHRVQRSRIEEMEFPYSYVNNCKDISEKSVDMVSNEMEVV